MHDGHPFTHMNSTVPETSDPGSSSSRLAYLDAARAFALVLGIVFHASLSFMPSFIGWAVQDVSTSPVVAMFVTVSHSFRMEVFFLIAGVLSHQAFHRKGAAGFLRARLIQIGVPFLLGWLILRPLLVSGWIMGSASLRGDVDVRAGLVGGVLSLSNLPSGLFTGSHLWFLYYLAMISALVVGVRSVLASNDSWRLALGRKADEFVEWLANSRLSLLVVTIPTAAGLWFMRGWGMDTPDQSLIPHLPVMALYGGFFALGWMLDRQRQLISRLARLTPGRGVLAGMGIASILLLGGIERDPGHPHFFVAHLAYVMGYSLTMWTLVMLTLGFFEKWFKEPSPFLRYIADSSYWMYLIHLPLVVWMQVAVAEFSFHWMIKLVSISVVTLVLSLISYDLFVRSTFLGQLLNGRRRDRVLTLWVTSRLRFCWNSKLVGSCAKS